MKKTLIAYCDGMEERGLQALGRDVHSGALDWFAGEFEMAIRAGEFTPARWDYLTNVGLDDENDETLDADLRLVWSEIAPDRPYPGDPTELGRSCDPSTDAR